jgi:hypothetical protein
MLKEALCRDRDGDAMQPKKFVAVAPQENARVRPVKIYIVTCAKTHARKCVSGLAASSLAVPLKESRTPHRCGGFEY